MSDRHFRCEVVGCDGAGSPVWRQGRAVHEAFYSAAHATERGYCPVCGEQIGHAALCPNEAGARRLDERNRP